MRFGKRLAEVVERSGGPDGRFPYVSYKDLKHMLSEICISRAAGGRANSRRRYDDDSEDDVVNEAVPPIEALVPAPAQLVAAGQQRAFFDRVDSDVACAAAHVGSVVAALEVSIGEWQSSAVLAGLLFTEDQLEKISSNLDQDVDRPTLVKWLISLRPAESTSTARRNLVEKYRAIADQLNELLVYIEVNLTAVRKILKKFEKKVPANCRVRNAHDYRAHHALFSPEMQQVLATAADVQRLLNGAMPEVCPEGASVATVPLSQIGPESVSMLTWLRGGVCDDLIAVPAAHIDVYAKPGTGLVAPARGASGPGGFTRAVASYESPGTGSAAATTVQNPPVAETLTDRALAQQAAQAVSSAEFYQGPPPAAATASALRHRSPEQRQPPGELGGGRQPQARHPHSATGSGSGAASGGGNRRSSGRGQGEGRGQGRGGQRRQGRQQPGQGATRAMGNWYMPTGGATGYVLSGAGAQGNGGGAGPNWVWSGPHPNAQQQQQQLQFPQAIPQGAGQSGMSYFYAAPVPMWAVNGYGGVSDSSQHVQQTRR